MYIGGVLLGGVLSEISWKGPFVANMSGRYLTKSKFLLAMECPTKLYYSGKDEYADQSQEDSFLAALADGGFQVGALARCYFPDGHMAGQLDDRTALAETSRFLQQENVVLYEPAFLHENLFARVDVLVKEGHVLRLYEVKAKSWDPAEDNLFKGRKNGFSAAWKPYLYDVAFQVHVVGKAMPGFSVEAFLMLVDKSAQCPSDGLNQKFRIRRSRDRNAEVLIGNLTAEDLSVRLLTPVPVDACVSMIFHHSGFEATLRNFAECYAEDRKIPPDPGGKCGKCQFKSSEKNGDRKSGFRECWEEVFGWQETDFNEQSVLDLWNYRRKDTAISQGKLKLADLGRDDLGMKDDGKPGLSRTERQLKQIEKVKSSDSTPFIDREHLAREMASWRFPLHFIDFETAMVPIPFIAGRHPYETVAFQFSHHVVEEDGSVRHAGEFLGASPGVFPNYEFVRKLKAELGNDEGSIFRYSLYENTVLNIIHRQVQEDGEPPADGDDLCAFIRSISRSSSGSRMTWQGNRDMIDLLEMVKRYYYDPATKGSNSIKQVLPAVLSRSVYLQKKYSRPIYGARGGIFSNNFRDKQWIKVENGAIADPYSLLPGMFSDVGPEDMEHLVGREGENAIRQGGAAMTAYARLQYEEMQDFEREAVTKALLQYCELDTLAMVMLYEAWREEVSLNVTCP